MANAKSAKTKPTAEEVDALYQSVMTCEAVVDEEEVEDMADFVLSRDRMIVVWRTASALASKKGDFYKKLSTNARDAEALAGFIGPLRDTAKILREMATIMDCIASRIMIAGCNHEGFNDWVKAAQSISTDNELCVQGSAS